PIPLPPTISALLPYTTLFRSVISCGRISESGRVAVTGRLLSWYALASLPETHTRTYRRCRPPKISARWSPGRDARAYQDRSRPRSEEHTPELQSLTNIVCRLLLEKKKKKNHTPENSTKTNKKSEVKPTATNQSATETFNDRQYHYNATYLPHTRRTMCQLT